MSQNSERVKITVFHLLYKNSNISKLNMSNSYNKNLVCKKSD